MLWNHSRLQSRTQLQAVWHDLNERYFLGKLPPIDVVWSTRLTSSVGMFITRVGPRHLDRDHARRLIRLSAPLLQDQEELEIVGTLAHEMIHQWQFDVLRRRPNHGADFSRKMAEMNSDGLAVTVRHSLEDLVQPFCIYRWRCARCGNIYQRQRRTIRPKEHRCGRCMGPLREEAVEQVQGKMENGKKKKWGRMAEPLDHPRPNQPRKIQQLRFDFGIS